MFVHKSYQIPLYEGSKKSRLHVIFSDEKNWPKVGKLIQDHDDEHHEIFPYNSVAAFASHTESKEKGFQVWAIFTKDRFSHNTAAHEAVHILNFIFVSRGIRLDAVNDEPQAYLAGWISARIYESLPKGITIRKND